MKDLKVLDLGCGDKAFHDNWLSERERKPSDLWYQDGTDAPRLRHPQSAILKLFPEAESMQVLGVNNRMSHAVKASGIVAGVQTSIRGVDSYFKDFATSEAHNDNFDLGLICHPSQGVLSTLAWNGILDIIERKIAADGTVVIATDWTETNGQQDVIKNAVATMERVGNRLLEGQEFDTSWSAFFREGKTESYVFSRS